MAPVGVDESGMDDDVIDPVHSIEEVRDVQIRVTDHDGNITSFLVVNTVCRSEDEVSSDQGTGTKVEPEIIQQTRNPRE